MNKIVLEGMLKCHNQVGS